MPQLLSATRTVAQDLEHALPRAMTQTGAAWAWALDDAMAEAISAALWANGVRGDHHLVADRAEVWVWRARDDGTPAYVARVEGPDTLVYTWIADAQPETLQALVERLCPRDGRY
jgi:hypothetical protein